MTVPRVSYEDAQRAKQELTRQLRDRSWFVGAAITPTADSYSVRGLIDRTSDCDPTALPDEIEGVPVHWMDKPRWEPREDH